MGPPLRRSVTGPTVAAVQTSRWGGRNWHDTTTLPCECCEKGAADVRAKDSGSTVWSSLTKAGKPNPRVHVEGFSSRTPRR